MTIKNSQLNNEAVQAINALIDMDINAKVAFKLMRIIKEISSIIEDKLKLEKKIFDKYIETDLNGNPVPVLDDDGNTVEGAVKISDMVSFESEMSELMNIENEIDFDEIDFDEMSLKTVKIKDLIKIDFLFKI